LAVFKPEVFIMSWAPSIIRDRSRWLIGLVAALAAAAMTIGALAVSAAQATVPSVPDASGNYTYRTLDNPKDLTFNQLLGINSFGEIAGYFGIGSKQHPNKGYTLPNDGVGKIFMSENFPHSFQTQAIGINDHGVTVGFWADKAGANFGWYAINGGHFHNVNFPTNNPASPPVDQLLGVNNSDVAVGFYTDKNGNNHAYTYNIKNGLFNRIQVPGSTSAAAAGINNAGDIVGFDTVNGNSVSFLRLNNGKEFGLNVPGSSSTMATGINDGDEVVGNYTIGSGNAMTTFGFTWTPGGGFETVSDPSGVGGTVVNGVNDHGRLVGFYTETANPNIVDGFLATPKY
jgi:hypothetical protein